MTKENSLNTLLNEHRVVHMVGLSPNPERTSHRIAAQLLDRGFVVVPVHPSASEVLGAKAWPSLSEAASDRPVRFVNVFRASDALPGLAEEILGLETVEVVWLQLGIHHPESERRLREAGVLVVTDQCTGKEASRFDVVHADCSSPA